MQNNSSNTRPTPKTLEKVELKSSVDIIISPQIIDKIKHLCRKVPKLEWSGLLFYSMTGTIRKPEECKINVEDIFLMDIGTKVATGFDWTEDIVAYRMENQESLDWHIGHIHSHNDMGVFFSGTDWSELNDNCSGFNFYLSLIVNNYMDMTAKIAFTAEPTTYICKDEDGKDYQLKLTSENNFTMFVMEGKIHKPVETIEVPEAFDKRFQDVATKAAQRNLEEQKRQEQRQTPAKYDQLAMPFPTYPPDYGARRGHQEYGYDSFYEANKQILQTMKRDEEEAVNDGSLIALEDELNAKDLPDAAFLAFMLRLGTLIEDDDPIEAMEDINLSNLNQDEIVSVIVNNYPVYFKNFYEEDAKPEVILDNVLSILEACAFEFDFCQSLHTQLSQMKLHQEVKKKKKGGKI